ncbi:MAG: ABC transporter ATP-binding protein [Desulfobacteraceae bacterium]|nr:ABC transporter ATP-binding protein [Desulfobacteraceae bacterium]
MKAAVETRRLCVFYGKSRVLEDVGFSVREGEFFVIIGPNGSGKSTLVKALSGVCGPATGEIFICGSPLKAYSRKALARAVSVVPQVQPVAIPFTAAEVVLMGRNPHLGLLGVEKREDFQIAERAMSFTGASALAGREFERLSIGERQRVLIARAICQESRIVMLDEPTASLDPAHQVQIMELLDRLRREKGTTILMVSHDLNLAALYADRLLLMKRGTGAGMGTPREVLTRETLEEAYGCRLFVDENPSREVPRITLVPPGAPFL